MKQKTEISLCESFIMLLKKHPFPKITIQMIAGSAGVNRQTFYYHFDNVYDLMKKAFEHEFLKNSRLGEGDSWDDSMLLFLRWMRRNRLIIRNLINNVDRFYLRESIYPIILKCMSSGYQSNVIVQEMGEKEEEFIQRFITLGITQYTLEWVENNFKEPEGEIVDHIFLILKRMYR